MKDDIDPTEATNKGTTLRVPNLDGHAGRLSLIDSHPSGGLRGDRAHAKTSASLFRSATSAHISTG